MRKNLPLRSHLPVKRFSNIATHLREAATTIFERKILVLMVVGVGNVDLANLVARIVTLYLRKHTHFQAPVGGYTNVFNHVILHSKLTRKRIMKAVEVIKVIIRAAYLLQRSYERCNE